MKKIVFLYLCCLLFIPGVFGLDDNLPESDTVISADAAVPDETELVRSDTVDAAEVPVADEAAVIENTEVENTETKTDTEIADETKYPPPEGFPGLAEPSLPPLAPVRTIVPDDTNNSFLESSPEKTVIIPPAPSGPIKIVPKMPDANSGKKYRIQLGAYSKVAFAQDCFGRLKAAGFSPYYEEFGKLYRVVLIAVPAADMAGIARRLEEAGFAEAWVREER